MLQQPAIGFEWRILVTWPSNPPENLRGSSMNHDDYALLRTLAARPVTVLPPAFKLRMAALTAAGYAAHTQDGWVATAKGCSALEALPKRRTTASI
jgi:hypothetical protein